MQHNPNEIDSGFFVWAVIVGFLVGIGKLLDSSEPLRWRLVVGRAIVSAAIAAAAPVVFIWLPAVPRTVEFALAALFASLGTSGLQALARHFFKVGQ